MLSGTCFLMSHGMEHWHPDPEFYFKPGGGPILDMGPYYLAALINLLGPVARVQALSSHRLRAAHRHRRGTAPGTVDHGRDADHRDGAGPFRQRRRHRVHA